MTRCYRPPSSGPESVKVIDLVLPRVGVSEATVLPASILCSSGLVAIIFAVALVVVVVVVVTMVVSEGGHDEAVDDL